MKSTDMAAGRHTGSQNPLTHFFRGFVGKGDSTDAGRTHAGVNQHCNPAGYDARLAAARPGQDQQRSFAMQDRLTLRFSKALKYFFRVHCLFRCFKFCCFSRGGSVRKNPRGGKSFSRKTFRSMEPAGTTAAEGVRGAAAPAAEVFQINPAVQSESGQADSF